MVSDIIRNRAVFYPSLMSICWESTVFPAVCSYLQFYCAQIYVFSVEMISSEFIGFGNEKNSEIMPIGQCPPSVSMKDGRSSDSENEKFVHKIQTWDLTRIFNALDSDRDGRVSAEDVLGLLGKLGLEYFSDDNIKGAIGLQEFMSFDEFCKLCLSLWEVAESAESIQEVSHEWELREAFSVFDKDGDGFITPSELQEVLLSLGLREGQDLENCEIMITRFDKNSDGSVDFMEFEYMMTMMNRS